MSRKYLSSIPLEEKKNIFNIATAMLDQEYSLLIDRYLTLHGDQVLLGIWSLDILGYLVGTVSDDRMLISLRQSLHEHSDFDFRWTPRKFERMVNYYQNIQLASIHHMFSSLLSETHCSLWKAGTMIEKIIPLLEKQYLFIRFMREESEETLSVSELIWEELNRNDLELSIINNFFKDNGLKFTNPHHIYNLQNTIWGVISSNKLVVTNDLNYRALSNSIKNSHHSLFCALPLSRMKIDSYLRDYTNFIEAVSAFSYQWYTTTYGFMHKIIVWSEQLPIQLEYPLMMIDNKILSLNSRYLDQIIKFEEKFLFNHDLWHHLIPVYAEHFIIHHPDAPISYWWFREQYLSFALQMRQWKEEYEIWLWICQRLMLQKMFLLDPDLKREQILLFKSYVVNLRDLYFEQQGDVFGIANMIDHLLANGINRFLTIFSYNELVALVESEQCSILDLIQQLNIWSININYAEIWQLLLSVWIIQNIEGNIPEQIRCYLETNALSTQVLLIKALVELEILDWETYSFKKTTLNWLSKYRWLSIIHPQRAELLGYTERVQSDVIKFGDYYVSPLVLLFEQYNVFIRDSEVYNQRIYLRNKQQILLKKCSESILNSNSENLRSFYDEKMHSILMHSYDQNVEASPECVDKILLSEFNHMCNITNKYSISYDVAIATSKERLLSEVMTL